MGPQVLRGLLGRHESVGHPLHPSSVLGKCCELVRLLLLSEPPGGYLMARDVEYETDIQY
jgi:hypothetical protein